MQHPKDVKGSDRPLPRNDGKFVLDGKRVEFSDYGGSSKKVTTTDVHTLQIESMGNAQGRIWDTQQSMVDRLSNIEGDLSHIEADVNDLGDLWCDSNTSINNRLDAIELEIEVMGQIITKNTLALVEIEERIAIMQEKIDGID